MPVILNFSEKEKNELKFFWENHESIGKGGEGECFLVKNNVYKIYDEDYQIENPICKDDLPLESFVFPDEIYKYNNKVFAYKAPYIKGNQLKLSMFRNGDIPNINILKKALIKLIKDIYVLSKNNIEAIDLTLHNTLFDGNKFYIIDTLDYEVVDEDTLEDNIEALKNIIVCLVANVMLVHEAYRVEIDDKTLKQYSELLEYTKETVEKVKNKYKDKEVQKIKR